MRCSARESIVPEITLLKPKKTSDQLLASVCYLVLILPIFSSVARSWRRSENCRCGFGHLSPNFMKASELRER
jgi:hypothetical protein